MPGNPATGMHRATSLRRRIVIRVAGVAALLSIVLGVSTYSSVRAALVEDRETSAVDQVAVNGQLVADTIAIGNVNETDLLASLRPPVRSRPLLWRDGEWFTASLQVSPEDLPADLTAVVLGGEAARQRFAIEGVPQLGVGVPIADQNAAYFEVFPMVDLNHALDTLFRTLAIAGAGATALGAALGWWIARRVLRPIEEVGQVAERIAGGALETRLDEVSDPDLAVLAASFNSMANTLQRRIAMEARFSSDVSHELRTPLTTLSTSLSVLEGRRGELSDEGREALDLLSADVARFQTLVTDLIEISKHDAGVVLTQLTYAAVDTQVASILRRLGRSEIPLDIEDAARGVIVRIDEHRLERTLANLIENADSHGGGVTRIVVGAADATASIAVEDGGPGIRTEDRDIIFERFARGAASNGHHGGSGLGLALATENLKVQGGHIEVENRPDGGARFTVTLPRSDS